MSLSWFRLGVKWINSLTCGVFLRRLINFVQGLEVLSPGKGVLLVGLC